LSNHLSFKILEKKKSCTSLNRIRVQISQYLLFEECKITDQMSGLSKPCNRLHDISDKWNITIGEATLLIKWQK